MAAVIGAVNGILIAYLEVSPVLATLGAMMLIKGVSVGLTHGEVLSSFPSPILYIGNGSIARVPIVVVIFTAVAAGMALLLSRTPFGHRLKGGLSVQQPIAGDELRAIRRHLAVCQGNLPWLFLSERGQPLTRQAVSHLVSLAAQRAGLPGVHSHTLRHSCGYYLANKGHDLRLIQDYLGHRNPKNTVHYTRTAGGRFEGLWR